MNELYVRVDDARRYQPYRLVAGLDRVDVGRPFATPREAIDFCKRQAPRPGQPDFARGLGGNADRRDVAGQPEAPSLGEVASLVRTCVVCGRDLPSGSRSQRRTDTDACRRALIRQDAAKAAGADSDSGLSTSSQFPAAPGPSEAVDQQGPDAG